MCQSKAFTPAPANRWNNQLALLKYNKDFFVSVLIDYILTGRFMSIITYKHDDRLTEYRNALIY